MAHGYIYKITNNITKKSYIGQTIHLGIEKRIQQHVYQSNPKTRGYSHSYLAKAIHKYGKENFSYCVVSRADTQMELDSREKFCIRIYNTLVPNGYNLRSGGRIQSYAHPITRQKQALAKKGKRRGPPSATTIEKMRKGNLGKKRSMDTRLRLHLSHVGKRNINTLTPVRVIAPNGETHVFDSITDAAKYYQYSNKAISNALNGYSKTFSKGYIVERIK